MSCAAIGQIEPEEPIIGLSAASGGHSQLSWRNGALQAGQRMLAMESAIALSFDGSTYAVMMATSQDLEDFAIGFSLAEGLIERTDQIRDIDVHCSQQGIDVRIWLASAHTASHMARRRVIAGPVGCGLCGVESLAAASRPRPRVRSTVRFVASGLLSAMGEFARLQPLHEMTRAAHADGWWDARASLVREDVGRHNALDKLAGALARDGVDASSGAILLISRVSVEMVQKAAVMSASVIVAISPPTTLAVTSAEQAGITLAAIARDDGFDVFTYQDCILF